MRLDNTQRKALFKAIEGIENEVGDCEYSVVAYGFKTAVINMHDSLKSDSQIFCLPRYSVLESSKIS